MPKTALMFGSIGSIAETSDIQRRSYNKALKEAGLNWEWDREVYAELLGQAGGKERLSMLSAATGTTLSDAQIERIHARKTELACAEIVGDHVKLRPGVAELVKAAKTKGMKLALVTTTYQPNIDAILKAAGESLSVVDFNHIVTREDVEKGKPAPDAYQAALKALSVEPVDVLAIEDTAVSIMSAKRAGLQVVATPGEITAGQDFWQADLVVEELADQNGKLDERVMAFLN